MALPPASSFPHTRVWSPDVVVDRRPDGTIHARSPHPLGPYPSKLTERLEHWAGATPDRTLFARRDGTGAWQRLTYAAARRRARQVAQAFIDRRLSIDRTVLILSGNSLEHAIVALAAMYAGVPYAPVAPAYSLMMRQYTTLQSLMATMRPGLIFAAEGDRFEPAITAVLEPGVEVVTVTPASSLRTTSLAELEATPVTPGIDEAHAAVGPDTVAKVLFTSGSTGQPKGVINTQRMLCANQQQLLSALQFLGDEPPVLCDWLPWNHTFGGNHNFGIALYNGGTLYIDDGRPVPGGIDVTLRNLREIACSAYFNVPKGFEMLVVPLREDPAFRRHFFSRLHLLFYAAAGLRPDVAEGLQLLAVETLGHPVPWITGLGATESGPSAMFTGPLMSPAAHIGVPVLGLELKATPVEGQLEARIKGPNVTPGYWRDAERTRASFDDEGYYRMGDAIAPVDPDDLSRGFVFEGRLTEDFKLSTGTWVRVGAVRARLLAIAGDLIQDVVVTGYERDEVGALIFLNLNGCRAFLKAKDAPLASLVGNLRLREALTERLAAYNDAHPGSSTAIVRARLLDTPPSIDAMEITDKGSINQRAVLRHRAALVEALYDGPSSSILH